MERVYIRWERVKVRFLRRGYCRLIVWPCWKASWWNQLRDLRRAAVYFHREHVNGAVPGVDYGFTVFIKLRRARTKKRKTFLFVFKENDLYRVAVSGWNTGGVGRLYCFLPASDEPEENQFCFSARVVTEFCHFVEHCHWIGISISKVQDDFVFEWVVVETVTIASCLFLILEQAKRIRRDWVFLFCNYRYIGRVEYTKWFEQ